MSNKKGKVQRNFYYYDIFLMKQINDKLIKVDNQEEIFYDIFEQISKKQKKIEKKVLEPDEITVSITNGDKIYILVDKNIKGQPIEFRLVLCRVDALPLVENNGLLNFLTDYLPKNFTLAEITHCVIFPQYNIMGAEYNFSGARPTAIKPYLPRLYNAIDYVYCANKLDGNVFNKLKNGETFSLFTLSVKNDSAAMTHLMNQTSLFHLPFTSISDVDVFEISLKRRKTKTNNGFDSPIPIDDMDEFIREYREDIKSFKVSQGSIQKDKINLLYDKLVNTSEITKTVNKTVDSDEAYKIIKDFFSTTISKRI